MSNTISLPQQAVFDVPRSIAGHTLLLTNINGQLHLSTEQAMQLVGLTDGKTFRHHLEAALVDVTSRGGMPSPPLTQYEIPVTFVSTSDTGRGAGTQTVRFYHPRLVFEIGMRTRNTPNKSAIMQWLINVGNEVIQQGFVIDQHALQNDPNVKVRLGHRLYAHNYSQQRHTMADQNLQILPLISRCNDVWDQTGQLLHAVADVFIRSRPKGQRRLWLLSRVFKEAMSSSPNTTQVHKSIQPKDASGFNPDMFNFLRIRYNGRYSVNIEVDREPDGVDTLLLVNVAKDREWMSPLVNENTNKWKCQLRNITKHQNYQVIDSDTIGRLLVNKVTDYIHAMLMCSEDTLEENPILLYNIRTQIIYIRDLYTVARNLAIQEKHFLPDDHDLFELVQMDLEHVISRWFKHAETGVLVKYIDRSVPEYLRQEFKLLTVRVTTPHTAMLTLVNQR